MPRYKRRIRIEGRPEDTAGYMLTVKDAETGEQVTNVKQLVLTLKPNQVSIAETTYIIPDATSEGFTRDVVFSDNPEVSLTAYEAFTDAQKEVRVKNPCSARRTRATRHDARAYRNTLQRAIRKGHTAMMTIIPIAHAAKDFLYKHSDVPTIRTLRTWIEDNLKRSVDDVVELCIQSEVDQTPTDVAWKQARLGDKTLYTVTFSDKMSAGLWFGRDGTTVIAETPLTHEGNA